MEYNVLLTILGVSIVSAIGVFLWWLRKNDDYWKKRGVPYVPRHNIVDMFAYFITKPVHESLAEDYKKHGRVYGCFEFRTPQLTICDPDLLRDVLVKDFHVFNHRREAVLGDDLVQKMVTALRGEDWKRVRTIITPAFTSKRMRQMTHILNECSQTVVETLGKYSKRQEPVDVKSIFGAYTMDVIASAAFATKIDSHNDPENIFVKQVQKSFFTPTLWGLIVFLFMPAWIKVKFQLGKTDSKDFFKNVILQVIKDRKENSKKYDDLLQILLDAQDELEADKPKAEAKNESQEDESDQFGSVLSKEVAFHQKYKKLSADEIVAQCVLFFIVGYETTASTLGFMAYELALNPECQEKLIKEIDEAFEKHKKFDHDVIREMKYLDCVVSETLRMYPSLTRSDRTTCENYKLGDTGIIIEKGMLIGFNIHSIHHDPEFFPNPEKFKPERFFPENSTHPQYAYLPFGAGPRNCIGMRFALMEMKICMCNILMHYRLKKAETTKVPLDYKSGIFISVDKLPLIAEKRDEKCA